MAEDRKARLAALAAKSGRNIPPSDESPNHPADDNERPKISFRNYVPKDATLSTSTNDEEPTTKRFKSNNEGKSALEKALAKTTTTSQSQNQTSWSTVTPVETKKVNWDLKRDIADKMDKLEKRTQKAIVEMLRERLEREAAEEGDGDSDLD